MLAPGGNRATSNFESCSDPAIPSRVSPFRLSFTGYAQYLGLLRIGFQNTGAVYRAPTSGKQLMPTREQACRLRQVDVGKEQAFGTVRLVGEQSAVRADNARGCRRAVTRAVHAGNVARIFRRTAE